MLGLDRDEMTDVAEHLVGRVAELDTVGEALALLPHYVAERTMATLVREVEIP